MSTNCVSTLGPGRVETLSTLVWIQGVRTLACCLAKRQLLINEGAVVSYEMRVLIIRVHPVYKIKSSCLSGRETARRRGRRASFVY